MNIGFKGIILFIFIINLSTASAQKDSSDMRLDIGWTRDKDINLWPVLKYKKDTSIGFVKTDVLFSIYRYKRQRAFSEKYSHLFPVWRKKSNLSENDFRLFSMYYPSFIHYRNNKIQGIKSFDFLELAPGISALGFSKSNDGLYVDNNLLFLLWFNKNEVQKSSFLIFFPLYWSFKNPKEQSNTFFPLWSTGSLNYNQTKYTAISPLFWHFKTENKSSNILFPLFWNYNNRDSVNSSHTSVFFPLFWKFKKPGYKSLTILPLYSSGKDSSGYKKYAMVSPLYWQVDNYEKKFKTFLPFWYSYTDKYKQNRIFFPFVLSLKNEFYQSLTVLPFFSYGSDSIKTHKHYAITPLFWHFKNPNQIISTIWPIFWDTKVLSAYNPSHQTTLFPFFFKYKDNERSRLTIFPILFKYKNPDYKSFTLLPFFSSGSSTDSTRKHLSIATLFWQFKQENDTTRFLLPIWWNRKHMRYNGLYHTNVIFPLYWSFKNPERKNKVVFPLIWSLKNPYYQSFSFVPFFSYGHNSRKDQKHLAISPLYWKIKDENVRNTTLFPLVWITKNEDENPFRRTVIFPIWWSYSDSLKNRQVFFPFIWSIKNPRYTSIGVLPLFSSTRTEDGYFKISNFTPLLWKIQKGSEKTSVLFPLFLNKKEDKNDYKSTIIFPFFWNFKDSISRNSVLFPIVWSLKNPEYRSFTIFPLLSYGKSTDNSGKHLVISPLYWSIRNEKIKNRVLFPIFDFEIKENGDENLGFLLFLFRYKNETGIKQADFLWPFCQYKAGDNLKYFRIAPIIWYRKTADTKFFSFQPVYYQLKNREYADYHLFWQLFTYKNTIDKQKSWNLLWKTMYFEKFQPNGHEFRFLYLVFADVNKEGNVEKSFFPIYYFSKETNGNRSLSLFFYFYNSFRRLLPNSTEFYREERIFWFIRLRSNYKRLKAEGKI